jgi:hypothetical protein
MVESVLIDKPESIEFLKTHVEEALGQKVHAKILLRGTRDGKHHSFFHKLCDNKGPLLTLFKTRKGILCGGFSSVSWKDTGNWTVDKKCFIFSLKLKKIYKRLNDNYNLHFSTDNGAAYGCGATLGLYGDKIYSVSTLDPFLVPKNAQDLNEITEEK